MNKQRTTTLWAMIGLMGLSGTPIAETDHRLLQPDFTLEASAIEQLATAPFNTSDLVTAGHINTQLLQDSLVGDQIILPAPWPQQSVTLLVESKAEHMPGITTLAGSIIDHKHSHFVVSFQPGQLLGKFQLEHDLYVLEPVLNDPQALHVMHRPNLRSDLNSATQDVRHLSDHPLTVQDAVEQRSIMDQFTKSDQPHKSSTNDVKVLFLYANNVTNGNLLAANVVAEFNKILERSEVSSINRISAAGPAQRLNDDLMGVSREDLMERMTENSQAFTDLELRRDQVGADMVFLLVKTDLSITRVGGAANAFMASAPYGVSTDTWALGDYTAIHELGHMLGGLHQGDDTQLPGLPDTEFRNHGKEGRNRWLTIMGEYSSTCELDLTRPAGKQRCRRLPYFSNPDLNPPRLTWGELLGDPINADMVSVLEYTMAQAANWGQVSIPFYPEAVRGYSFAANKEGHGIHITKAGSGPQAQYIVYFYTFDQQGRPEWMLAQTTYANNRLTGQFDRVRYDHTSGQISLHPAGTFSIDYSLHTVSNTSACDGINRSKQLGVFNWSIDQQSGTWCLQPLFTKSGHVPDIPIASDKSGLWFEPASPGWGISYQAHELNANVDYAFATVYYYDEQGVGQWANGQRPTSANQFVRIIFNEFHSYMGYPRTATGTWSTQDIGSLVLDFDSSNDTASINALFPADSPSAAWVRNDVGISRLSY